MLITVFDQLLIVKKEEIPVRNDRNSTEKRSAGFTVYKYTILS